MAYKMKGPSLYPNYGKAKEAIKLNREDTSRADGRATSSPFQMHDGKKHKASNTNFADGSKKTKRDKFNDREDPTYEGTDEFRKEEDIPTKEFKNRGVNKDKPVKPTDDDMSKYSDLENYDDDNPTGKAKPKKTSKDKKTKDNKGKTYQQKKEALIKQGFTQADADRMIADGAHN